MLEGDVVIAPIAQADGRMKDRPALLLRELPPFGDFLVCGISTQLHQQVVGFDEVITTADADFVTSHLRTNSLIRLGFLSLVPLQFISGKIGSIAPERHQRLLKNLSDYLVR